MLSSSPGVYCAPVAAACGTISPSYEGHVIPFGIDAYGKMFLPYALLPVLSKYAWHPFLKLCPSSLLKPPSMIVF